MQGDGEGKRGQQQQQTSWRGGGEKRRERAHTIQEHSFHKGGSSIYARSGLKERLAGVERERCMCATAHKRAGDVESRRGCVAREEMWNDVDVLCGDFLVNVILVQKTRGALPATAHDRRH